MNWALPAWAIGSMAIALVGGVVSFDGIASPLVRGVVGALFGISLALIPVPRTFVAVPIVAKIAAAACAICLCVAILALDILSGRFSVLGLVLALVVPAALFWALTRTGLDHVT